MRPWVTKKIVVRDYYISFKPMGSDPRGKVIDLSEPITNQTQDEAVYIAVTGRPAGFLNFVREFIGLSRRFEFVMSSSQCIQRLGSPSTQILSCSSLQGLNTISVGLVRPLVQAILLAMISLSLVVIAGQQTGPAKSDGITKSQASQEEPAEEPWQGSGYAYGGPDTDSPITYGTPPNAEDKSPDDPIADKAIAGGGVLKSISSILHRMAPAWAWFLLAACIGLYAAYLFFVYKKNVVTLSESGQPVLGFIVSPSLLERHSTDIPLLALNRLPMIFRALKDK